MFKITFGRCPFLGPAALALSLLVAYTTPASQAAPTLFATGGGIGQTSGLWILDASSGAQTYVGPVVTLPPANTGVYNGGLAYDAALGRLYAAGTDDATGDASLYRIDRATGEATFVGYLGADIAQSAAALAFDPLNRRLFAACFAANLGQHTGLYELNPETGAATLIGPTSGTGALLYGLGFDAGTGTLYANGTSNFLAGGSKLFSVNPATGAESEIGGHGVVVGRQLFYSGISIHPVTGVAYSMGSISASQSGLYTVDLSSGTATVVGAFGVNIGVDGGLAFVDEAVVGVNDTAAFGRLVTWPNPASDGQITARFSLPSDRSVTLRLYDVRGRRVATLFDGMVMGGAYEASFRGVGLDGQRLPSGVYFLALDSGAVRIASTRVLFVH